MAGMTQRRIMAPHRSGGLTARQVKNYRQAEPWVYYDTRYFAAGTIGNDSTAQNFAQIVSPLPFFSSRTVGNSGFAVTDMTDTGKMDQPFLCDTISVDVWCDQDAPFTAGLSTAVAFSELVINNGILVLSFGTDVKLALPVIKLPAGGGVWSGQRVRTQALASNTEAGHVVNGVPSATAKVRLREPILFQYGQAFTLNLQFLNQVSGTAGPLHRLQGLTALTGDFQAGIRINLEGVRGKMLLQGVPAGA